MKVYFAGDKSKAVCPSCGLVETVFQYRDVDLEASHKTVKNILVGVCTHCGLTVSTPAQSTPAIKAAREAATESIEAQLPSPYLEILDLACLKIDPDAVVEMRKRLLLFYIHQHAQQVWSPEKPVRAYQELSKRIAAHVPKKRLSMKVSKRSAMEFEVVVKTFKQSKTDTLKHILAEIKMDILDSDRVWPELRTIAAT